MHPPVAAGVETKFDKTNKPEYAKSYDCGLCDTEVVYKIAQELLPGLAESCVDSTTGGIFKSAGSVAFDMRKEMTDYLTQRSETYVAEFLLSENTSMLESSEHPHDIIIKLIDDFSSTKTNMFSRVSEWVLTDRREDRIDDFVQEMEINGFWLLARREYVASMLLKNVDYKNAYHCNMVCSSEDELIKHRSECKFRPMDCINEGCTTRYCAAQKENHEAVCPFMILPCEQKCSNSVMRREMDRHCVTICPMKLVNCAFYTVGCKSSIPQCNIQQHNADDLSLHLMYVIRTTHKQASDEDLIQRVEQIRKLSNTEKLAKARDARALTYLIKDVVTKIGLLDVKTKPRVESPTKTDPLLVKEDNQGSQSAMSSTEKTVVTEDDPKLPTKQVHQESVASADSPVKVEENKDEHEDNEEEVITKSPQKETVKESSGNDEEKSTESTNKETVKESFRNDEEESTESTNKETGKELLIKDEEESIKSTENATVKESLITNEKKSTESTNKETGKESFINDEEESIKSTKNKTVEESLINEEEKST